jgi:hypothetical protein
LTKPATPVVAPVVTIPAVITPAVAAPTVDPTASASGTQELHLDNTAPVPAGPTPAAAAVAAAASATTTHKSTGGDSLPIAGIGFAGAIALSRGASARSIADRRRILISRN